MLDETVAFLIFSLLIPVVLFILKFVAKKYGFELSAEWKQILAAVLSIGAVGLQVWVTGTLPEFAGDSLAILKTAVAFFGAQMALYEVVLKRIWGLME